MILKRTNSREVESNLIFTSEGIDAIKLVEYCKEKNNLMRLTYLEGAIEVGLRKEDSFNQPRQIMIYEHQTENDPGFLTTKKRLIMIITGELDTNPRTGKAFICNYEIEYIDSENYYCVQRNNDLSKTTYIEFQDEKRLEIQNRLID